MSNCGRAANLLESRAAIQRHPHRVDKWAFDVQERQMQRPAPGRNNPISQYRLGTDGLEDNSAQKHVGVLVDNNINKLAACPCSEESQQHPGLYQQDWSQQSKGSD